MSRNRRVKLLLMSNAAEISTEVELLMSQQLPYMTAFYLEFQIKQLELLSKSRDLLLSDVLWLGDWK